MPRAERLGLRRVGPIRDGGDHVFRLLNPIYHVDTPANVAQYKVEPYVVAADVYGVAPHIGRGGWTRYTGSAAWIYRLGLEGILGIHRAGAGLVIEPHIPAGWPGYDVTSIATASATMQLAYATDWCAALNMTVDWRARAGQSPGAAPRVRDAPGADHPEAQLPSVNPAARAAWRPPQPSGSPSSSRERAVAPARLFRCAVDALARSFKITIVFLPADTEPICSLAFDRVRRSG